ncbi:MAG: hypothetical protein DRI30_02530 [Chloroflexi bacterium]|nr:MAG: hypothetical protein DRI30_02530 [Chloroflexota bacterium]
MRLAWDNRDFRLLWQLDIVIGGNCVNQYTELETVFAKGLNAHARTATDRVTKVHENLIALAQESTYYLDVNGFVPGTDIAFHIVFNMKHGAVRGLNRDIISASRVIKLGPAHIAGKTMHDFYRTGVIDSIIACGKGQYERLIRARLEIPFRFDRGGAHLLGKIL